MSSRIRILKLTGTKTVSNQILPVVLAGGKGTRLRPRTLSLPKPLLPVAGRPLLWHVISTLEASVLSPPVVSLDYLEDTIRAFFEGSDLNFVSSTGSMLKSFLDIAKGSHADAFAGFSSDVLMGPEAIDRAVEIFDAGDLDGAFVGTSLADVGHKSWQYVVEDQRLINIERSDHHGSMERMCFIVSRQTLVDLFGPELELSNANAELEALSEFGEGWTFLLKLALSKGKAIGGEIGTFDHFNVNVPEDFGAAEKFLARS